MNTNRVSTKQFVLLIFLSSIAVKMFLMPALLLRTIGRDGIWTIAFFSVIEFINLGIIIAVCLRNPDKTFFEIVNDFCPKIIAKLIFLLLFGFIFLKSIIIISEIKVFFIAVMYRDINWAIMAIPLIALTLAFAFRSIQTIGRSAEILTPAVLVSTIILSVLLAGEFRPSGMLPIFENGIGETILGIDKFPLWFGDSTIALLFMGRIKISKGFTAGTLIAKTLATIFTAFFCIVLYSSYGQVNELIDYGNTVSNLSQLSLGSQDYGRFDLLFYCVWMFSVLIKLAECFSLSQVSARAIVGRGSKKTIASILAIILYVFVAIILNNEETTYLFAVGPIRYVLCPVVYFYPLLTLVFAVVKYKSNYQNLMQKGVKNE